MTPGKTTGEDMTTESAPPLLEIHDATVRKGEGRGRTVLDGLSLTISQGEHTAILGPNGSGKSSLIKLITQEYRPLAHADGEPVVRVFGRERWNVFTLRTLLGIVSADLHGVFTANDIPGTLRGLDVVLSGFFASRGVQPHHAVTTVMRECGRHALTLMDAAHLANKPMREMSTGEARRVLIARALAPHPRAVLLDEPTTGLDLVAMHRFLAAVRGLAASGVTIILVTHHVEEIIPEIGRVVLLREGRVLCDGPKHTTLTSAALSTAFDAPLHVARTPTGYYTATAAGPDNGVGEI